MAPKKQISANIEAETTVEAGHPTQTQSRDVGVKPKEKTKNGFSVRVTASAINIYKAPAANAAIVTKATKGAEFTVEEKQGGWGKVSGGAGWIRLALTENSKTGGTTWQAQNK